MQKIIIIFLTFIIFPCWALTDLDASVVDSVNILQISTKQKLDEILRSFHHNNSDYSFQIIIRDNWEKEQVRNKSQQSFAQLETKKKGMKAALLFIGTQKESTELVVNDNAERVLSDRYKRALAKEVNSYIRNGFIETGVLVGASSVLRAFGDTSDALPVSRVKVYNVISILVLLFAVLLSLVSFHRFFHRLGVGIPKDQRIFNHNNHLQGGL